MIFHCTEGGESQRTVLAGISSFASMDAPVLCLAEKVRSALLNIIEFQIRHENVGKRRSVRPLF